MAKRTPPVQLRKPPPADVDKFVSAQEHTSAQPHKRIATQAPKRNSADAHERARLHCIIPAELHQWLALQAVVQKRDMGEIVVEALERLRTSKK
jgi:hypothetical protein